MKKVWHKWYDKGVPTWIDYPSTPIKELFNSQADYDPDRPYLIYGESHLTYGTFNKLARKLANGFLDRGLKRVIELSSSHRTFRSGF